MKSTRLHSNAGRTVFEYESVSRHQFLRMSFVHSKRLAGHNGQICGSQLQIDRLMSAVAKSSASQKLKKITYFLVSGIFCFWLCLQMSHLIIVASERASMKK